MGPVRDVDNVDAYARKALVNEFRSAWRRPVRRVEQVVEAVPERAAPEHGRTTAARTPSGASSAGCHPSSER